MSDGDHCKACGSHHASKGRFCPMCGHSYDCGGCGGCQQCPICGNDRHEGPCDEEAVRALRKDFNTIIDELIKNGRSDTEILDQLANGYGYPDPAPELLIALIRVAKEKEDRPPFQTGDLTTYLEMAKFCLDSARVRGRVANELDLSDEEIKRLQKQLEEALNHE